MARFRLELGPVPLHHQVYLDLQAALDDGEWRPGDRLPPERELARQLRLQPDHRPARAGRARAASGASSATRAAARSCCRRASIATSLSARRFTEEMQRRGLDPGDARSSPRGRRPPARPSPPRSQLEPGSPDAVPRATAAGRRRAAAARDGPPAGGAVPGPARQPTSSTTRCTTSSPSGTGRRSSAPARPSSPCCCAAREARLLGHAAAQPGAARRGHRVHRATASPVEFGRTYVRGDRTRYYVERVVVRVRHAAGPGEPSRAGDGRRLQIEKEEPRCTRDRRAMIGRRWRDPDRRLGLRRPPPRHRRPPSPTGAATAPRPGSRPAPPVHASRPRSQPAALRWYCCLGTGEAPEQVAVEKQVVDEFNARTPDIRFKIEIVHLRRGARHAGDPDRRRQPARHRRARSASAAPKAFQGQWLDLAPLHRQDAATT